MSKSVPSVREHNDRSHQIDPKMLELLVCPQTKGPLIYDRAEKELVSKKARLAYPIRDGVPILLTAQARILED